MSPSNTVGFLKIPKPSQLRSRFGFATLLLGFNLLSAPLLADPVTLSEKQALELFFQRNLNLLVARYNIENAMAQEIIASAIPNPTVNIEVLELSHNPGQNSTSIGCAQTFVNTGISHNCGPAEYYTFSQLIEMAGKRGLRMQSTAIATQAAESDFRDAVRILSNMVRDAYYALLQTQKNRWLNQEIVNFYTKILNANRLRHQAGDIAESDLLRIEIEAMRAQSDLDNAQTAVEQAQAGLAVTLNWPDKSMDFLAAEEWPQIRDIGQNLSADALLNKALTLRPDLQADKIRANQAETDLAKARRLKFPDITFNAGYARDPGNTVLNTGFMGISIPLPLFYQYQGEESHSAVNLNQMRLAAEQTELSIRADVENSLAVWKSSDNIVKRYENELLERARKVRERMELAYEKGGTTVLDFIQAQRDYKSVMLNYFSAETNRTNAYYDLAKSLGIEPNGDLTDNNNPELLSGRLANKNQ
jgi:cobalt-zinc-cadmium efflux system outer membrane protein